MILVGVYRTCAETDVRLPGKKPITLNAGTKLKIEKPGSDSSMKGPCAQILSGPHKGTFFDPPESVLPFLAKEE